MGSRNIVSVWMTVLLSAAAPAVAQTFPADAEWTPMFCGDQPAFDPVGDEPAALNERDAVGDSADPAIFLATDASFAYFRMRLDDDPLQGTAFRPFGWAVEFDFDGEPTTYELIVVVDGISNPDAVILSRNTTQRTANDPSDPPESEVSSYPAETHARGVAATAPFDSAFGGSPDFFVDWAIPLADLAAEGLTDITTARMVFGTSSSASAIDADIVCNDGATDAPTLTGTYATPEPLPPAAIDIDGDGLTVVQEAAIGTDPTLRDTDGDGFDDGVEVAAGTDPTDPTSFPTGTPTGTPNIGVRGGGGPAGCAAVDGAPGGSGFWLLVLLVGIARRRPRR